MEGRGSSGCGCEGERNWLLSTAGCCVLPASGCCRGHWSHSSLLWDALDANTSADLQSCCQPGLLAPDLQCKRMHCLAVMADHHRQERLHTACGKEAVAIFSNKL